MPQAISTPQEPESIVYLSYRTKDTLSSYPETSTGRTAMATSQTMSASRVVTQRDLDESQELQDRGIKKEFWTIRTYMDKRFELVDERFKEQRSYMDERFGEQRSYIDDRFQQVDDRFQQVDDRFQQVDDRFQQVDDRFQDLEVLIKNSRATSGWQDVFPVREPRNQHRTPPAFPNKVVKFWRLQRPRKQPQLVELLRFYDIRASDLTPAAFEDDDDDAESEGSFESSSTLERVTLKEAVEANPAFALARLAARLGLDYGSISHNMGLYEQIQAAKAQQEAQRTKREQPGNDVTRPSKRAAMPEVIQAQRSGINIPIEMLTAHPESFSYESPPAQSYIGWAPQSKEDALPLRASTSASSSKKAASTPPPPSKGSTVPFTHTPSVVKGAERKTTSARTSSKQSQTSEETSF